MSKSLTRCRTLVSPIDGGWAGWRSECQTHGTVLKCHATKWQARVNARLHRSDPSLGISPAFFTGWSR